MAAKYRTVDTRIWTDEAFVSLDLGGKLIAFYLLTSNQCNRIGLYRLSVALAAEELGLTGEEFDRVCDRVCDTMNWQRHKPSKTIYIPRWWKYHQPSNIKHLQGNLEDIHDLPQTPLLQAFATNTVYLTDTVYHTLLIPYRKGMPYQEQEWERDLEQEIPPTPQGGQGGQIDPDRTVRHIGATNRPSNPVAEEFQSQGLTDSEGRELPPSVVAVVDQNHPQPPDVTPDATEKRIAGWIGENGPKIRTTYCPAIAKAMRELVDRAGWEAATALVIECAKSRNVVSPVKTAVARWDREQGMKLAENANNRIATQTEGEF